MRRAFTLIESVLATLVLSVLVVVALDAVGRVGVARQDLADRALAQGLAEALAAEIQARAYRDPDADNGKIGVDKNDGGSHGTFNDVDDYHGLDERPPTDDRGVALGSKAWRRWVKVEWVKADGAGGLTTSDADTGLKRITVVVEHAGREASRLVVLRSEGWDAARP